jgi:hypothetical protein
MITSEALAIYHRFRGDVDAWQRAGSPGAALFGPDDWSAIENLLQELTMVSRGQVSDEYAAQIRRKLADATIDQSTADSLLDMV